MNKAQVQKAVQEAEEFLGRAGAWLAQNAIEDAEMVKRAGWNSLYEHKPGSHAIVYGKNANGDLRRQSMELTRALSEMRKP